MRGFALASGIRPSPGSQPCGLVVFEVAEPRKGASKELIIGRGYGLEESCGVEFHSGMQHLVYTSYGEQGKDTSLQAGLCTGTKPLNKRGEADLQTLEPAELALHEM
jgi:hypothetical protein